MEMLSRFSSGLAEPGEMVLMAPKSACVLGHIGGWGRDRLRASHPRWEEVTSDLENIQGWCPCLNAAQGVCVCGKPGVYGTWLHSSFISSFLKKY